MSVVNVQEDNNEPAIEPQSVVARDDLVVSGWPQATTDRDIFGQLRSRLEKRQPHVVPPWWVPPHVSIAKSADEAIEKHDVIKPGAVCVLVTLGPLRWRLRSRWKATTRDACSMWALLRPQRSVQPS